MAKDLKILLGMVFVLLLLVGLFYPKPEEKPESTETANVSIAQAIYADGIDVKWVTITDSAEVNNALGINLNDSDVAVIIFESRYETLTDGAAGEYVKAITKAFESNENITYAVALASNIVGRISKKPVLAWADRALAEEIKGLTPISAYNHLGLTNLEPTEDTTEVSE